MHIIFRSKRSGTTLIEVAVYIACLALLTTIVSTLLVQLIRANTYATVSQEEITSARSALDTIASEIRLARSVYTPTSVLDTSPGQLSLETAQNAATLNTTYVDFYVDAGRLYRKRENQSAELLTADNIIVQNFTVSVINSATTAPFVRLTLGVNDATTIGGRNAQPTITLTTAVDFRPN